MSNYSFNLIVAENQFAVEQAMSGLIFLVLVDSIAHWNS